jgi:hypothetical protein
MKPRGRLKTVFESETFKAGWEDRKGSFMSYWNHFLKLPLGASILMLTGCFSLITTQDQKVLDEERFNIVNPAPLIKDAKTSNANHKITVALIGEGVDYNHPELMDKIHYSLDEGGNVIGAGVDLLADDNWPSPYLAMSEDIDPSSGERTRARAVNDINQFRKLIEKLPYLEATAHPLRDHYAEQKSGIYESTSMAHVISERTSSVGIIPIRRSFANQDFQKEALSRQLEFILERNTSKPSDFPPRHELGQFLTRQFNSDMMGQIDIGTPLSLQLVLHHQSTLLEAFLEAQKTNAKIIVVSATLSQTRPILDSTFFDSVRSLISKRPDQLWIVSTILDITGQSLQYSPLCDSISSPANVLCTMNSTNIDPKSLIEREKTGVLFVRPKAPDKPQGLMPQYYCDSLLPRMQKSSNRETYVPQAPPEDDKTFSSFVSKVEEGCPLDEVMARQKAPLLSHRSLVQSLVARTIAELWLTTPEKTPKQMISAIRQLTKDEGGLQVLEVE